jgi:hypothetical protein
MKIILICGLPGSGKTHLGLQLKNETGFEFFDDINQLDDLFKALSEGKNCIVTDTNFVRTEIREAASNKLNKFSNLEIEWLFFENNAKQCLKNVNFRNDNRKVKGFIQSHTALYKIPVGEKQIKVFETHERICKHKNK